MTAATGVLRRRLWVVMLVGIYCGGCGLGGEKEPEDVVPPVDTEPDGSGDEGDNGGGNDDDTPKVTVGLPGQSIGADLIGIHDPGSSAYNSNCISCHGDRLNEVALDGVTPAVHSTMKFGFLGSGNQRCMSCHQSGVDFLSFSAGGLREQVNMERDLVSEFSCTSCHAAGEVHALYVR